MTTAQLPSTGFISLSQIIGSIKSNIPPAIPVSRTTWWRGVKEGRYPQGVKISARRTAWRAEDIQNLLNSFK